MTRRTASSSIETLEARIAPAVIVVSTLRDITDAAHDTGSLRDAIFLANSTPGVADTIVFQKTVHGHTQPLTGAIVLTDDLPGITDSVTINGPMPGKAKGFTINGNQHRIFDISAGDVTIKDLTLTGGQALEGAAIRIDDAGGTIQLTNLTIAGNVAKSTVRGDSAFGGGIGIEAGKVTISDSRIVHNSSIGLQADETNSAGRALGGGIYCNGTLTIKHSIVSGNVASGGSGFSGGSYHNGGGALGGAIYADESSNVTILQRSVVSGNKALGGTGSPGAQGVYDNGEDGGRGGHASGGGVYSYNATMSISDSTISGNLAQGGKGGNGGKGGTYYNGGMGGNGGHGFGGGVASYATTSQDITIQSSTLSGNKAVSGSPGVGGAAGGGAPGDLGGQKGLNGGAGLSEGGALYAGVDTQNFLSSSFTASKLTIARNVAAHGAGVAIDGGGTVSIQNSTLAQNIATKDGGGVSISEGTVTIQNSTIALNIAGAEGGGVFIDGGTAKIHNSTIAKNQAKLFGGGLDSDNAAASVELISTIIAGNKAATDPDMIAQTGTVNASFSLVQKVTAGSLFTDGGNNITAANPLLGLLKNNGGPTLTMLPAVQSPVINKGSNPDALPTDQRGTGFNRTLGAATDIGAVEVH